ncbi:carbohydrate ABC transporter permease [Ilumatobacter sp.]|uniref:carbohydrate ABC transporter permease n=1 Tax=Ilumatobacter sp. TaxID=1967498 RepID=UPI003C73AD9B
MTITIEPPVVDPSAPEGPTATPKRKRRNGLWSFTLPAAAWYFIFTVGPLVAMIVLSMVEWPGLLADKTWVGFENYREIWGDRFFWQASRNTAVQLIVAVPVMIPLSFMLGYYLSLKPRGHRVLSVLFFTPGLLSITAKGMIFFGMFAPNGAVNGALESFGLDVFTRSWTSDPDTALATVIAVDLWGGIGWTAVLFAARLTSVPSDVYEAASLDGAGHLRRIRSIAYPMTKDFVGVMTMLQFLWTLFNSAAIVLLLTRGGPAGKSSTLSYYVYERAFSAGQVGYSQAVGVVLALVGVIGLVVIRRTIRQDY